MASDASQTCPSCGARVPADADQCDLCGASVEADGDASGSDPSVQGEDAEREVRSPSEGETPSEETSSSEATDASGDTEAQDVFCNQCGWKNPPGSNFCSRCGTELQSVSSTSGAPEGTRPVAADLPGSSTPPDETPPDETPPDEAAPEAAPEEDEEQQVMGRQIMLFVGGAVMVLVALFFVTLWSQSQDWGSEASSGPPAQSQASRGGGPAQGGGPVGSAQGAGSVTKDLDQLAAETASEMPTGVAERVDSLRQVIQNASGDEKQAAQEELVNVYVGAGQTGRAAVLQQTIAESTDRLEAWRRAGDLLYRWMQRLQQQGQRQQAFPIAQAAAKAYETVSSRAPDDLQARTRMGESYLLTNSPMKGIQTINGVLEDDSTFVPARFQKGLAFLQISRFEQAIAEFEAVKRFTSEGEPYYRQADRAIRIIRERTQSSSSSGGGQASSSMPQEP